MSLHADAVAVLEAYSPAVDHARQHHLRDRFLTHLASHPAGVRRTCRPDHLTAGVVVLSHDLDHVMLTLHRKALRWFHFGGHLEDTDVTVADAALREGLEESGLRHLDLDPTPVHLDEHPVDFCGRTGTVHHLDVRFTATAGVHAEPTVSDESVDVRWWPLTALPAGLDDDMHVLIAAARERWRRPRTS